MPDPKRGSSRGVRRGQGTGPSRGGWGGGQQQGRTGRDEDQNLAGRRGGRGRGRGGEAPDGDCVCTKCGFEEKHVRGRPCWQRKCPKCGGSMMRKDAEEESSGT